MGGNSRASSGSETANRLIHQPCCQEGTVDYPDNVVRCASRGYVRQIRLCQIRAAGPRSTTLPPNVPNQKKKTLQVVSLQGFFGTPNEIRTRVAGMKIRCPRPLDDGSA